MKTTGEIISDLLQRQGKTQLDLAEYLVMNEYDSKGKLKQARPATVNAWIKKGKIPKGKNLLKVAEFLGVSTDVILGKLPLNPADENELIQASNWIIDKVQLQFFITDRLKRWGYRIIDYDPPEQNEVVVIRDSDQEERHFTPQEFEHWMRHMKALIDAVDSGFDDYY